MQKIVLFMDFCFLSLSLCTPWSPLGACGLKNWQEKLQSGAGDYDRTRRKKPAPPQLPFIHLAKIPAIRAAGETIDISAWSLVPLLETVGGWTSLPGHKQGRKEIIIHHNVNMHQRSLQLFPITPQILPGKYNVLPLMTWWWIIYTL